MSRDFGQQDLIKLLPRMAFPPWSMAAVCEQNATTVRQAGGERLEDTRGEVRVRIAVKGNHRTGETLGIAKQRACTTHFSSLTPHALKNLRADCNRVCLLDVID